MKLVAAALILQNGKLLICQRTRHQPMPLKWEFPGGKIEEGEQPRDAMRRELDEELGIDAKVGEEVARIRHSYKSGGQVELRFFVVHQFAGEIENRIFRDVRFHAIAGSNEESYILVEQPRMYQLVDNRSFGTHTLELLCPQRGLAAFAFTFTTCLDPSAVPSEAVG